jgi:hypothetical protein
LEEYKMALPEGHRVDNLLQKEKPMNFETCTFTTDAEAAFAASAIRLFRACPAQLASKKIVVLLTADRLDAFVYPAGSHANALSHATWLHEEKGFVAEAAAVFGGCATPGCPCGEYYFLMSTLLPNGQQHTAESQPVGDTDLEGQITDIPALLDHFRALAATPGALDANMVIHS